MSINNITPDTATKQANDIVRYPEPKSLADYGISTAPQSFCYLGPQYSPH